MQSHTIQLAGYSVKSYRRSDKCEIVTMSTGWNVLDSEQRADLEWIYSAPNRAGRIRECVRRVRLMMQNGAQATTPPAPTIKSSVMDNVPISDDDILDGLI